MRKSFDELFEQANEGEMKEAWEKAKNSKKKKNVICIIIALIVDVFIVVSQYRLFMSMSGDKTFMAYNIRRIILMCAVCDFIVFAISRIFRSKGEREYNTTFKKSMINSLFNNFFDNVAYFPEQGMPQFTYSEGNYRENYNRYKTDDYVKMRINSKYQAEMAEITTQREETTRDADGNTTTTTVTLFSGLFAKINIEKSIKNELRIKPNTLSLFNKNKLEMDSEEFEKIFDVISNNKIIGMQILTHDVMDLLVEFKKEFKKEFDIYINNNIMYLRFHVGPMFEAKINKDVAVDRKSTYNYYKILEFIDKLAEEMIKAIDETEI